MDSTVLAVKDCIAQYKLNDIEPAVKAALDAGVDPKQVLDDGMIAGMAVIGEGFKNNTIYMPQMLMAAKAMQKGLDILRPALNAKGEATGVKAVVGTVMGDVHDIGKNIVCIMFEGCGMEVVDLGADVPPQKFVDTAKEIGASFVACSCSMTPNRESLKNTADLVNALPNRKDIALMVGGATMDQMFCDEIGADIYTEEAATASDRAKDIMGGEDRKAVYDKSRRIAEDALAAELKSRAAGDTAAGEAFHRHAMEAPIRAARAQAGYSHKPLTMRENVWETLKHEKGQPDRFVPQYDFFQLYLLDPVLAHTSTVLSPEPRTVDAWNITNYTPPGAAGSHPLHGPGLTQVPDITKWEETITIPTTKYPEAEWEPVVKWGKEVKQNPDAFCGMLMITGLFERTHFLMGLEHALVEFYEHPDEMHAMIDALTDWEVEHVKEFCSRVEPEVLFHHDDWGTAINSFLPPDVHREFYFKPYQRVYNTFREMGGKIVIHHSDSYAANLVPIWNDLKVDIWQGCISGNNIPELIDKYGDKICFMGGLDNGAIDMPGWKEDAVRQYITDRMDENGTVSYIPCLTRGLGMSIVPDLYPFVSKTIAELSPKYF